MLRYTAILLTFTLLLASCQSDDPSTYSTRLRISLTDFIYIEAREVIIDIRRIEIAVAEPAPREIGRRATEDWVVLDFPGGEFNVMELTNGRMQQILDQWTPANNLTITAVTVVFGNNSHVIRLNNQRVPIRIADEFREGAVFEMARPLSLHTNTVTSIIIDLNTHFSLYGIEEMEEGERNSLYLYPQFRAFPEATTSTLRGTILRPEIRTLVTVSKDGQILRAIPEFVWEGRNNGRFEILGVSAGYWNIHIVPLDTLSAFRDTTFVHYVRFDASRRVSEIGNIGLALSPAIITVVNVTGTTTEIATVRAIVWDYDNEIPRYQVFATSPFQNRSFTLQLVRPPMSFLHPPFVDGDMTGITVSDNSVRMTGNISFDGYNSAGDRIRRFYFADWSLGDTDERPDVTNEAIWVYADRDVTITGEHISIDGDTLNYNTNLRRGWNIVYVRVTKTTEDNLIVEYSSQRPSDANLSWRVRELPSSYPATENRSSIFRR